MSFIRVLGIRRFFGKKKL